MDYLAELARTNAAIDPGPPTRRQPVHTFYGGAQLFKPGIIRKLGDLALAALDRYGAPDPSVEALVRRKLETEPIEDYRLDFEDGFGVRSETEEENEAIRCATGFSTADLPPFAGFRPKSLGEQTKRRSLHVTRLFLTRFCIENTSKNTFLITLPKVTSPDQVRIFAALLDELDPRRLVQLEVMIETPESVRHLREIYDAANGRLSGAHFGAYDYTAALGITSASQTLLHPACDFARHQMQLAYARLPVFLSDGATNIFPVPVKGADEAQNRESMHAAWNLHIGHITHSLENGFYQSWDLHPAQLVSRYTAVFRFYRTHLAASAERLKNFIEQAARATLAGSVFDDAASAQSLLTFFARAVDCGAVTESEAAALCGLTLAEIRTQSFDSILMSRQSRLD